MAKLSERPKAEGMQPEIWAVTEDYLQSLSCPRALTVYMLCKYGEWMQVASLKAKPKDYRFSADYHKAALATDWLRKWPDLPVKVDRVAAAKESWLQSEKECMITNIFLRDGRLNCPTINLLLDVAGSFFCDVLGPCPMDLSPRFGPGTTESDPASHTTVLDKVSSRLTLTQGASFLLPLWSETAWARALTKSDGYYKSNARPRIVEGNSFFTVPKTALIDRACAKGPSVNIAYQLALGQELRQRLLCVLGLDLVNGQRHHQRLAQIGSATGEYATIDSERASDTQAYHLIKRLCSRNPLWWDLLDSLREPSTRVDGKWIHLHKFSAMGNGFTFELETLTFLSLAYAAAWVKCLDGEPVGPHGQSTALDLIKLGDISVYGDDVIVPTEIGPDVAKIFEVCGFTVNLQKFYFDGEFRESCGGDYFRGQCVNTVKLSDSFEQPADYFSMHNLLKKRFVDEYPNVRTRVLTVVKDQIPRRFRNMYGPDYLGDRVLHGWYGPQLTEVRGRLVKGADGELVRDSNQWVSSIEVLTPQVFYAEPEAYAPLAQLANLLYSYKSQGPARRPTTKLKYTVTRHVDDYHVIFMEQAPRAPAWLAKSPYARQFGIHPNGTYVG